MGSWCGVTHILTPYSTFARGVRYGFDRARWRGLWRVQIQEYLISAIQDIEVLLRYGEQPKKSVSVMVNELKGAIKRGIRPISGMAQCLMDMELAGLCNRVTLSLEISIF